MKPRRFAAIALPVLIAAVVLFWFGRPATQLERRKAVLRARGEKLTAAEFLPHAQPPATTLDVLTNLTKQLQVTAVHPSVLAPMEMVDGGKARSAWQAQDVAGHTWEDFDAQFTGVRDTLAEIRNVLAPRPRHPGWDYKDWSTSPPEYFVERRTAVHWLAGAALNDLHYGRLPNALQNLNALIDAANTYDQHWSLISQMIRIAIADVGLRVTWEALQTTAWTEEQLLQLQRRWESTPIFSSMEPTLEGERVVGLELFEQARKRQTNSALDQVGLGTSASTNLGGAVGKRLYQPAWRAFWSESDEIGYLDWTQSHLEAIRLGKTARNWQQVDQRLDGLEKTRNQIGNPLHDLQFRLSEATKPNVRRALRSVAQTETLRQMAVAAIAIRRFELREQRPPDSLAELGPQFLAQSPVDYMDGKSLRYRRAVNGRWMLYSVGRDGIDDGGKAEATDPTAKSVDLWTGRDMLWPIAEDAPR
jgi:hypothetical protein